MECEFFDNIYVSLVIEGNTPFIQISKCCNLYTSPTKRYLLDEWEKIPDKYKELLDCHKVYPKCTCPVRTDSTDVKYRSPQMKGQECYSDTEWPLHNVSVSIDPSCNNKCKFCYCKPTREAFRMIDTSGRARIIDAYFNLMEELKGKVWGIQPTTLGEPFFYKERMINFLKSVTRSDFDYIVFNSNGINLDSEAIDALISLRSKDVGVHFNVSLNAWDSDSYSRIMGTSAFSTVIKNIENLSKVDGIQLTMSFVMERDENMKNYLKALKLFPKIPKTFVFNGKSEEKPLTKKQLRFLEKINKKATRLVNP